MIEGFYKNWDSNKIYGEMNGIFLRYFDFRVSSWTHTGLGSGRPVTRSLWAKRGSSRSNYGGKVLTFGCFSNPVYSYVNFCNLERDGVSGDTGHGI